MKRKILISILAFITIIGIVTNTFAATDTINTRLDIIKQASETKYLENDQGYISKTIVDSNPESGEVTVELKVSNTAKEVEASTETEIFLVVDNSGSMGFTTSTGEIRRDMIVNSLKTLVNYIFEDSTNVKLGLVRFANKGDLLTNSTALMCNLTNNKQDILNAINEYENLDTSIEIDGEELLHCESGTNIEAGLKKANDNFTTDCKNKILVLLTDGLPNAAITSYSSKTDIYNATKKRLQSIGNSGTTVISMMTGVTTEDDDSENINSQQVVEQIFGTETNPTTGKFYNIADANLETVVTENIRADIMEKIQNPISTVKITDYFPEDITENFEFSYVGNPSIGTASESIDEETKTISWDIGTLKGDEVATLKYKLKLKDMQNQDLLEKTIATNEKVVLEYQDINDKEYTVTLSSSPQIKLTKVETPADENGKKDPTLAQGSIPQTGENIAILAIIGVTLAIGIVSYFKIKKYKNI